MNSNVNILETKKIPKDLNKEDTSYILSIKGEDVNYNLLRDLLANTKNHEARFLGSDRFKLPKGHFYNDTELTTTIGKYLFNIFVLNGRLIELIGYQNTVMNKKGIGGLNSKVSSLLLNDKLTTLEVHDYINRLQWLGFRIARFMNASLTYNLLIPTKEIEEKKQELIKKYQKAIDDKDIVGVTRMEEELLEFSKKNCTDIPDMEIYESGGRGNFGNNFKNTTLMRGIIKNYGDSQKLTVSTNSLVDGIPPEEMSAYADMIVQAVASRAIGTKEGGAEGKKINAAYQDLMLDEAGSDCHTKLTVKTFIDKGQKNLFIYRYLVDSNGELVLLTPDNIDKYVNTYVNLRSPMKCAGKKICNKCAGELYYKIGNSEKVGLLCQRVSTRLLNLALKSFHDSTIHLVDINIEDYIK